MTIRRFRTDLDPAEDMLSRFLLYAEGDEGEGGGGGGGDGEGAGGEGTGQDQGTGDGEGAVDGQPRPADVALWRRRLEFFVEAAAQVVQPVAGERGAGGGRRALQWWAAHCPLDVRFD